ncbi:MAG: PAS domain-containing sensor histidine kinase [Fimbriimonadaceae bacterium]|nr:PAS domain-containing sensor histidine kinase [Chitinophagales bacterium]
MDIEKENNKINTTLEQFEALFRYSTIGIIITDSLGSIINVNNMAETEFGFTKDELIGEKIEILIPDQYKSKHETHRDNFYQHPHNRSMGTGRDLYAKKKDGKMFPVEISLSHYTIDSKLYAIAFIIDITVRKGNEQMMLSQKIELEKNTLEIQLLNTDLEKKIDDRTKMLKETLYELETSRQELNKAFIHEKELGDLKSRFVTMASHEFRTPLSTILSSVSLLGKYTLTDEQDKRDKHIGRIKEAVQNMKNILEDFLSLGKLEEGSVKAKIETMNTGDFIFELKNTITDMQQICRQGQTIQLTHELPVQTTTDINLFKNILINLLSNAIKFSPENSVIHINLLSKENNLMLSVKDNGIGISKEDQTHLFERFFRAKNATNVQGTGLGLHIIGKYVELLDGKIELQSQLDKGTEFIIFLPQNISN